MKRQSALKGYQQTSAVIANPGGALGAVLRKGDIVRFVDLEGRQVVDFLSYNALDTRDRYNVANMMKMPENLYVSTGTVLYVEYATPLMKIAASSGPNHDTIGGGCSVEVKLLRHGRYTHNSKQRAIQRRPR